MRLLSIAVRNYRLHENLNLEFDPSRTLIGGPNESGKSTLVEAIHRALFLRAKTTGNLQREMVSTLHSGEPAIILAFQAADTDWTLEKNFAGTKGSTLLTNATGSTFRDDAADDKLSELLKTGSGGRANANQLAAAWSHLWVWQGRAGDDPATHSGPHKDQLIQHLQQDSASAVLQSATDQRVAEQISKTYDELFTNTGRPKAGSKPERARVRLEEAEAALETARAAAARLAEAAADHSRAEIDIAGINAQLPMLREQRQNTETRIRLAEALRRDEENHRNTSRSAIARREELEANDLAIRKLQKDLAEKIAALGPSDEKLATLSAEEQAALTACQSAEASLTAAADTLRLTRLQHDLATAATTSLEKAEAHQAVAKRAAEATALHEELTELRAGLAKLPVVGSKDLADLRKLESTAAQAAAALNAMATGVELIESANPVTLDGHVLTSGESFILTDSGDLRIGDSTHVRIRPGGGQSLAEARQLAASARETLITALERLALRDLDHAAATLDQRQSLGQRINTSETKWNALGGDSLTSELARATTERDTASEELQRRMDLANARAGIDVPADLPGARERVASTRDALAEAESAQTLANQKAMLQREKLAATSASLALHRDQTAEARQAVRDLETAIATREETQGDEAARTKAIAEARETEAQANANLQGSSEALAALNPDQLSTDLERFSRALGHQEERLLAAQNTRLVARDRLTLDGSTDPEAELRIAEARHSAARETYQSELRRAKAIESLQILFTESREAIDQALVQPLADRISGYLQCLFGADATARVRLSDSGIEGLELVRTGDSKFGFAALSGGAREQVAAAVRLALAEILAAEHDGCLPVLFDDAFAYSDPDRIQTLQRMLDLAAVRGLQIVVLTCAPADYSAFGAAETRLCPIKSQQ